MVTVGGAGSTLDLLMLAVLFAVLLDALLAVRLASPLAALTALAALLALAPLLLLVLGLETRGLPVVLLFL